MYCSTKTNSGSSEIASSLVHMLQHWTVPVKYLHFGSWKLQNMSAGTKPLSYKTFPSEHVILKSSGLVGSRTAGTVA